MRIFLGVVVALAIGALQGCGGSSSGQPSVSDPVATPNPAVNITIRLDATLDALSVVGGSTSFGSGVARLSFTPGRDIGNVTGQVEFENIIATRVSLRDGFAGTVGEEVFVFEPANENRWMVPAGRTLTPAQMDVLEDGGMYVRVDTVDYPDGALRGQLAGDAVEVVVARLSGEQEVPMVATTGNGTLATTVDIVSGAVRVHVNTSGVEDATAAHVHRGFAGSNGGVVAGLNQDGVDASHWWTETTLDADALGAYLAGELYVNVHTATNAPGELRGQIAPDGIDVLFTSLSGTQEVPSVSTDAVGLAATTIDTTTGALVVHVHTMGISDDAFAAHLHTGFAGANGGVVFGLAQDGTDPGHFSLTDAVLDAAGLAMYDAGELYINVHTNDQPGGELRGQIAPESVDVIFSTLSGMQEVPEVQSDALGMSTATFNRASGRMVVHVHTQGADDATAAHVHQAFAGSNGGVAIGLEADASTVGRWSADAVLDVGQQMAFGSGQFYVNVHTPANPGGELRGQVVPAPIQVVFSGLEGEQSVPAVETGATGLAATTLDPTSGAIVAHVRTEGVDDASAAHIHRGMAGTTGGVVVGLEQDPDDVGHWMTPVDAVVEHAAVLEFLAGELYFNVHTPANPAGEIRGQINSP